MVIKPVDNMGGRGCRLVRTEEELEKIIREKMMNIPNIIDNSVYKLIIKISMAILLKFLTRKFVIFIIRYEHQKELMNTTL